MPRRFGSAMISNTDSTLLVYCPGHILVKVYKGGQPLPRAISTTTVSWFDAERYGSHRSGVGGNRAGFHIDRDLGEHGRTSPGSYSGSVRFTAPGFFGASVSVSLTLLANLVRSGGAEPLLMPAPTGTITVGPRPRSIAVGGLNSDGHLDLAVANLDANTVSFEDAPQGIDSIASAHCASASLLVARREP